MTGFDIKIERGPKANKPVKAVIYGPEGIGKSTFAAQFPAPLFIDTEGSTDLMDVMRFPRPEVWEQLLAEVEAVIQNPTCCKTLVIDTGDWAERLCETYVCKKGGKEGIEDFGYGKGYTCVKEEFGRVLDKLSKANEAGINIVVTAHCIIRKFERPDEMGAYDRYELKLGNKAGNQCAALLKEWADCVLFANYKEIVTEVNGKNKVQGGRRVMYTNHAPTWDAKNRFGLKEELPFEYEQISQYIPNQNTAETSQKPAGEAEKQKANKTITTKKKTAEKAAKNEVVAKKATTAETYGEGVDPELFKLCEDNNIQLYELQDFVTRQGILSRPTPAKDFPAGLVKDLIRQFDDVKDDIYKHQIVPF